jgi:predicted RNA-binding protein with RPS1 domain
MPYVWGKSNFFHILDKRNMDSVTAVAEPTTNESFAQLFEESLMQEFRPGQVITAEVVDIDDNFVVVNAGLKSESYIPKEEFLDANGELEVKVGDFVKVAIEALEDGYGETRLSRRRAKMLEAWDEIERIFEEGRTVTGRVTGRVKGGLTVNVMGLRAFLPGSLVDIRPVRDTTPFEGQELEFKIIKVDRKRNNIVVSRRAVLEEQMGSERERILESLEEGAVVQGVVKNITDYGAFVDLGGIDGLLHITDLAWRRVRHPSEVISVGDEVTVKVLKFDREKMRVSLGMKQLGDDPWVGIARRYPAGTRLFGKVTNLTDYGAFVEIEPGIEGLVHVSGWIGPTRIFIRPKWCKWATKSRSWCSKSTKNAVGFRSGSSSASRTRGKSSRTIIKKATKCAVRSNRSPISGFSSVSKGGSMGWCTFPTSLGPNLAKWRCAATRRATRSKRSFWGSTSNGSGFRLGSSSSRVTPSPTTLR